MKNIIYDTISKQIGLEENTNSIKFIYMSEDIIDLNAIYIDSNNVNPNRDGTYQNPYNSFAEFTIISNKKYKLKKDSSITTSTPIYCNGLSNVVLETYGSGEKPKFRCSGSAENSYCIMFNNCDTMTLDGWEVSGSTSIWSILRNDSSNNTTINNCTLNYALYNGPRGGFGIRGSGNNLKILNSYIGKCSNDGLYLADVNNLEIGYCQIEYVNLYDISGTNQYGGDGIQLNGRYQDYHIHHTLIDRNVDNIGNKYNIIITRNNTDPVLDGGIIEYCIFRQNSNVLGSILLGNNLNTIIRYNRFEGPYAGTEGTLKLKNSTVVNTIIYCNLFYNITGRVINLAYGYPRGTGKLGSIGTKIFNNTFYNIAAYGTNWGCIWNDETAVECRNNLFHMNGNTGKAFTTFGSSQWTISNSCFDVIESTGSTKGTDYILGNPLFVNPINYDFHIQNGSPCIGNGINVGISFDFDGVSIPNGGNYDIGAYEYNL